MTRLAGVGRQRYLGKSERALKLNDQGLLEANYVSAQYILNYRTCHLLLTDAPLLQKG